ncbi:hypothetical protein SAMD00019534_102290 [Acytostelium subglobosum LB1]|uniref:hypothetical protein n=1 Tax=Acytostelium subglobosum LB1 TaxID=1410327 RepID=UPI000644CB40|nr:hypothetical protein SAMD00019534_102290 [Acytostelium subglobosum LB1]GAM27054.1 hypothetical protein SAMD00019534_102290 [Acytostelium subglobosum LB1]|eukprot:XP_012749934.1 hypothetical protein SAMD00019534_102290 [Acytostelium subglobosum LB1]
MFADAKYFHSIACCASQCDDGLARAIAYCGNDILMADYCEAADDKTLALCQRLSGASMAFLKLCNLAGIVSDWQLGNMAAGIVLFRVLG